MGIVTKFVNGYTIHTLEDTPVEQMFNPIKGASAAKQEISSCGRLHQLQEHEFENNNIKSASTEELKEPAWLRLRKLSGFQ